MIMICLVGSLKRGTKPRIILTSLTGKLSLIELLLYLLKRSKIMEPVPGLLLRGRRKLLQCTASDQDATPRGEHYIRCFVACEPSRPDVVPLRLALCYEDGTDVSPQDASCLKILGEATHLSCPPHAKETTFYYRLELGSFRRADRKFRVRVTGAGVAHCLTPPLLVLSKTKPLDASAPLSPPTELPDGLRRGQRPAGRKRTRPCGKPFSTVTPPTLVDFHTGARPAVGPFDPAAVAERRAIHEQILAINRRLENLKGSLSDLTVRLGAHSAAVTLPPTESA